jgi:hypothetical protein
MINRLMAASLFLAGWLPASPMTLTLTGVNGQLVDGLYVSPYQATLEPSGITLPVFCDDFTDEVSVGQTWGITEEQGTNVVGTKFNPADYPTLFWLAKQDAPANYVTTQLAMWSETDPTFADSTTASNNLLADAVANQRSVDLSDWQVYTPTAEGQEFVADSPEPATMVLFGFGLVAVGFLRRKSIRQRLSFGRRPESALREQPTG